MAIRSMMVPWCDACDRPWLPEQKTPDGRPNPAFSNPSLCKRCGKCKSYSWNGKKPSKHVEKHELAAKSKEIVPQKRVRCRHQIYDCPVCSQNS